MGLRRIDAEAETHRVEFLRRHHRRLAAFEDVDQGRTLDRPADNPQFLDILRRFDKADIGTGFEIGVDPVDRRLQPLDRARVGARDDDEIGVLAGVDRGVDLADHLGEADHLLALVMAAFLGRDLVFDVKGGDPRFLVLADRADDVDRVAVAGIGVGDDRDFDRFDRHADKADVLGEGQEPEIGIAVRPRIAAAGQIDRLEPGLLDETRGQSVIGAGHHRIAGTPDQPPHLLPHRHPLPPSSSACFNLGEIAFLV